MCAIPCLETADDVYRGQTRVMHSKVGRRHGAGQALGFVQQICSVGTAEIAEIHLHNCSVVCN